LRAQHRRKERERYEAERQRRHEDRDADTYRRRCEVMNSSTVRNLESDLQEVGGHKVYNTPEADVVMFVVEALRHEENLSPELQRMKVMLEATAVMLRGRQTASQAASTRTQHAYKQRTQHWKTRERQPK
jgi:hypothetical protein